MAGCSSVWKRADDLKVFRGSPGSLEYDDDDEKKEPTQMFPATEHKIPRTRPNFRVATKKWPNARGVGTASAQLVSDHGLCPWMCVEKSDGFGGL